MQVEASTFGRPLYLCRFPTNCQVAVKLLLMYGDPNRVFRVYEMLKSGFSLIMLGAAIALELEGTLWITLSIREAQWGIQLSIMVSTARYLTIVLSTSCHIQVNLCD